MPTSTQRKLPVATPEAMLFIAMAGSTTLASVPVGDCPVLLTVMRAGLLTSLPKADITWSFWFKAVTVRVAGELTPALPAT